jgi:YebC/PmpR family DNA-binding regulatory protein
MSGHSKWSTIKRQKGVTDAKRGAAFTKVANAITIAARSGGESPETNFKLRLSIEDAKRINMPKGNIEKAIARGVGKAGEGAKLEELTYEGFGPGGVAILVSVVTDNRLRAAQEVRSVFERSGGSLAGPGSVSYLFSSTAQIAIDTKGEDPDEIVLVAADSGADDVDVEEGMGIVYCRPESLEKIKKELEGKNLKTTGTELSMKPKNTVKIEDKEKAAKVLDLMEKLDGLSDVQKVYANFDIPDEILQKEATSQ